MTWIIHLSSMVDFAICIAVLMLLFTLELGIVFLQQHDPQTMATIQQLPDKVIHPLCRQLDAWIQDLQEERKQ